MISAQAITPAYLSAVWERWVGALRDRAAPDASWPPRRPGLDLRRLYPPFWLAEILDDLRARNSSDVAAADASGLATQ